MSKDEYLITDAPLKALTVFAMTVSVFTAAGVFAADDQQLVADMQAAVLRGDGDMVVGVGDPRNDERAVDKLLHLAHRPAVEYGVGELNRYFVGVFLVFVAHRRQRLVLLLETDA